MKTKRAGHKPATPKKVEETTSWKVKRGSAVVRVYLTPHGEENYYTISYWIDSKRKRQVFDTLKKARKEAKIICKQLTAADSGAAELNRAQRASFHRAMALLEPSGAALEFAASEYASAVKRLGAVSLSQAVDFYLKRHPVHLAPKLVPAVIEEFLKLKRGDQLSRRYLKQLEYDLNRFMGRFRCRIGDASGADIDAWLREQGVGPRTRNNLRNSIQALFNFAIGRKYLPKDHDELDAVPLAKDADGEIEIFTPEEMTQLLAVATPAQLPFLAIGAFAGVRHAELQRLDWVHVRRDANVVEIRPGTAKTARRRVIPLLPNLRQLLAKHWKESGPVCPYVNMALQFVELTRCVNVERRAAWAKANGVDAEGLKSAEERASERLAKLTKAERKRRETVPPGAETAEEEGWRPFAWKHNALRHSFISYRVAQIQNVAQVALEAGNSPHMIFKHYRELVRPADAKKWFAIGSEGGNGAPKKRRAEGEDRRLKIGGRRAESGEVKLPERSGEGDGAHGVTRPTEHAGVASTEAKTSEHIAAIVVENPPAMAA